MPVPSRFPVPRVVAPSLKVTVPVAAAEPEAGVTWAVKMMLVPLTAVVAEAVSVVVVAMGAATLLTVMIRAAEVLPLKLESPL